MNVYFVSRDKAETEIKNGAVYHFDFISISDTWDEASHMRSLWNDNLPENSGQARFYTFKDIDSEESEFSDRIAKSIVTFVNESQKNKRRILVHCFAGISRSGAVAKFINDYLGLENEYLNNYVGHNHYVYNKLMEAAGIPTLQNYYNELEKTYGNNYK